MKRSLNKRTDTSLRPTIARESTRPMIPHSRTLFRFPSETNYGRQTQLSITHANFQAAKLFAVAANQIRPTPVAFNSGIPWNRSASQMNRHLSGSLQRRMAPMVQYPNYFSWRNPVNITRRFPSTPPRFPETCIVSNFALRPRRSQLRFGHSAKQVRCLMNRKWQFLAEGRISSPNDFTFSVVAYNVLSDKLLFENKYLYQECSEDVLSWEYRRKNLLKELLCYNADILCLQEVDADHYIDWFQPKLSEAGYTGVYNQRSGDKPDGCVTFYRHSKFTLVEKKLVKYYTSDVHVLDRDNVGIVVLLKPNIQTSEAHTSKSNQDTTLLCVANTHLLFNKKRGDIKLAQLAYLFAEVDSLAMLSSDSQSVVYCPVILCGDFNSLPYSPLHHFLTTGQLEYSSRCPAVISGQLLPSEYKLGQSSRCIGSPLFPWRLGITLNCQWRDPQDQKGHSDEDSSKTDDRKVAEKEHEGTTVITMPFQFQSVYKHCFEDGMPEVTTCHSKACCNVDYIFFTPGHRERTICRHNKKYTQRGTLSLLGKLELLRKSDIDIIKQLPNNQFSSDHISLQALFKLT